MQKIFVSGSSKTQMPNSDFYRNELPEPIMMELQRHMDAGNYILVGDAPGIDAQVQDYLSSYQYSHVKVYAPGLNAPRHLADSTWEYELVPAPGCSRWSKEWLAAKDIHMAEDADEGLAVIAYGRSSGTTQNVVRLWEQGKPAKVFQLSDRGPEYDIWVTKG